MATGASLGVLGSLVLMVPAHAEDSVVVRGTAFPLGTGLARVGCSKIFDAGGSPVQPYVAQGAAPLGMGSRSLGFDLAGGDASGPVHYTASMASTTTASLSAIAPQGATGVAWAGYQEPGQEGSGRVWFGRAPLALPAGGWTSVEVSGLTYDWAEYDTGTGQVVAPGPRQSVPDFVAEHGQVGPGLWAVAFGCDGKPFNVDALRFGDEGGTTTYDLEGLATRLTILGRNSQIVAGESVGIDGTLSATGDAVVPHATAILERRPAGTETWQSVRVADSSGGLTAFVQPPTRTEYRWRFADRPLAEASTSPVFVVDVARAVTARVAGDGRSVTGSAAPGRAGLTVTLRPADGSGPVARTTTGPDGAFDLPLADLASGRYVASVAAADGNLAGESVPLSIVADPVATGPTPSPTPAVPAPVTPPDAPATDLQPTPKPTDAKPTDPKSTDPKPTDPEPTGGPGPDQTPTDATGTPSLAPSIAPTPTPAPSAADPTPSSGPPADTTAPAP